MVEISKDFLLTHSVLNFLRASYVGQLVFHQAIQALKSKLVDDSYVEGAHRALDKLDPWIKELFDGMPIISANWAAPETFEAIRAFGYLKEVRQDLEWLAGQVETALSLPSLSNENEAVRLLVATLVRTANVRAAYLDGVGAFFASHKDAEQVAIISAQFNDARQYVQITTTIFNTFNSDGPFEEALVERLRQEASLCPADLRAQAYDATLLLNSFVKKFDYEHSELPAALAKPWKDQAIPASVAGYWIAYKLTPEETKQWTDLGLSNASLAANWKRSGFTPSDAISWANEGLAPAIARVWKEAGFDAARAAQFVARGVLTPDRAVTENEDPPEQPEVLE